MIERLRSWLRGPKEPPTYSLVEWLFLRILGGIYLAAFASLGVQVTGLIGSQGILPVREFLPAVQARFGARGYWLVPTVFWLDAGDVFLKGACLAGVVLALLLIAGYAQRPVLISLFLFYLSLVSAGQDFLAFQWDNLLLETGFLAIFLGGPKVPHGSGGPQVPHGSGGPPGVIWLFRWLVFRLIFLSGAVKLLSGDLAWRSLTALDYHYETQPLPTPIAWYMHQLPDWFQKLSVLTMFCVELVAPFLIVAPRRLRSFGAAAIVTLQALIALTGNYAFFNWLAASLCLFLLDDAALRVVLPERITRRIGAASGGRQPQVPRTPDASSARPMPGRAAGDAAGGKPVVQRVALIALAVVIALISSLQIFGSFVGTLPRPGRAVLNWLAPFRIVNAYGLFAVMTTSRPEIVIEGSTDGQTWLAYEFRHKPGDVNRPPPWVAPHQPRLDWQMWFAALGSRDSHPWFGNLLLRLAQGSPDVLALMGTNPFPEVPPLYLRARVYDYHFADFGARRASGAWWSRTLEGAYY